MVFFKLRTCVALLLLVALPGTGRAATCPDSAEKLRFLRSNLAQAVERERAWSLKWSIGWASLTAIQLTAAPLVSSDDRRKDLTVGAFGSAMGLVPTLLIEPRALWSQAHVADDDSCEALAALVTRLESVADDERFMHSWVSHSAGALFSMGLAMVLGFGYRHWGPAAATLAFGLTASEVMIGSRPEVAIDALARYRAGNLLGNGTDYDSSPLQLSLLLDRDVAGVGISMGFP